MKSIKFGKMVFLMALICALLLPTIAVAERIPTEPAIMKLVLGEQDVSAKALALKLNKTSITLAKKGKTFQLKATGAPAGQKIFWESSNTGVARVSATGKVTAVAPGNIYIAVYTADNAYTAICKVTVKGSKAAKLSKKDMYIKNGKKTVKLPTTMANVQKGVSSLLRTGTYYVDNIYAYDSLLLVADANKGTYHSMFTYRILNNKYNFAFMYAESKVLSKKTSPIKTNRGIAAGTAWSKALKLYGQATYAMKGSSSTDYYYELPYGDLYKTLHFNVNNKSKKIAYFEVIDFRYVH